eukprot:TRINITY_DN7991_c0_g1_i2.p2 TRINITY_DN7991_c0_g1~~TRINITY_DN7991_c0_g1_i2.p2  ORF type:complete len:115 (-),score=29.87 TRINITY_DN7991_c0_g1_i2:197-541(-)
MVFNVLFGSRILPQAMRPVAQVAARRSMTSVVTPMLKAAGSPGFAPQRAAGLVMAQGRKASLPLPVGAIRGASGYRRETQVGRGRFWIFMWIIGAAIAAGFMEEIVGPMVLFHS